MHGLVWVLLTALLEGVSDGFSYFLCPPLPGNFACFLSSAVFSSKSTLQIKLSKIPAVLNCLYPDKVGQVVMANLGPLDLSVCKDYQQSINGERIRAYFTMYLDFSSDFLAILKLLPIHPFTP